MSTTQAKWFYRTLGEEFGPVTRTALQELISSGQLARDEQIREESSSAWIAAADLAADAEPEHASVHDLDMMLADSVAEPEPGTGLSLDDIDLVSEAPSIQQSAAAARASKTPRWYCRILGEQVGPFDFATMCVMVRAGHIKPTDRVRLEDELKWLTADGVDGLFDGVEIKVEARSALGHVSPQRGVSESAVMDAVAREESSGNNEDSDRGEAKDGEADEFDLKPAPEPKRPSKKPGSTKKPTAAKGKSSGKRKEKEVDPMDYLSDSEPETSRSVASRVSESQAVASTPRTSAVLPGATQFGADTTPNMSMPVAPPPRPVYVPPAPPPRPAYTPPKRSSSSSSVDFKELLASPIAKGILALLVIAPIAWFAWGSLGRIPGMSGVIKNDKYYYDLTEGVFLAVKAANAEEFKDTVNWVEPLLKEIKEGTGNSGGVAKVLNQCATELIPKVVSGTFKEKDKNLEVVEKALAEAKSML